MAAIETRVLVRGVDEAGGDVVVRLSTHGYLAAADEGRVDWLPDLEALPEVSRALPLGLDHETATSGYTAVSLGNRRGQWDWLRGVAWGREAVVLEGPAGAPTSAFVPVLTGIVDRADVGWETADLILRDRLAALRDRKVIDRTFLGTSLAGGQGAEGGSALAGQPWPTGWGVVEALTPVEANTQDHIYSVGVYQSVVSAWDGAAALTVTGGAYPTLAALLGASIATGQLAQAPALGLVRLGAAPASTLTLTVRYHTPATLPTLASAVLTGPGGLTEAEVGPGWASLDAVGEAGWWTGADAATVGDVLDGLTAAASAHWIDTPTGVIDAFVLSPPELAAPVIALDADDIIGTPRLEAAGTEVPAGRLEIEYRRAWTTVAPEQLPEADTAARLAYRDLVSREWRLLALDRPTITTRWPHAGTVKRQTALLTEAGAAVVRDRLAALYAVPRRAWTVTVRRAAVLGVDVGQVVDLSGVPRLGLGHAVVTSLRRRRADADLTVWG
ncbi:hypothetical protein [Pararhodospirillum oryzae]|uniref:Uncharacterized protein n=1 Tax=Pararhodospirillum oryzae TaxID=478448 RepID=A0A512HBN2_9PROT|nr:hypothetical protein [Pararhodospirillum oryzae]GEO82853.1 hypothetical protein ROR02_29840 [Pararhodospirillum oryzae]